MELKPIRIKSCFNLCGALASVLLCILGSANNYAALLLRTLLHTENGNRTLLWCGAIFNATPSICLHFMPFVRLFCVCACVSLEKPQQLVMKPVLENLIRCKKNNNKKPPPKNTLFFSTGLERTCREVTYQCLSSSVFSLSQIDDLTDNCTTELLF